ncbi:MAG: hypothetical protein H7Y86_15030 [Rhizobacter sp.]|nr:hypothetical protein [Ferruginibacter sp.]
MDTPGNLLQNNLYIDEGIESHFKESGKWAKYIAITGMLFSGIALVASFTLGGRIEGALNSGFIMSGTAGFMVILAMLLFAVAYFILSHYMYRFANKLLVAVDTSDRYEFVESMRHLKNTYKVMAILFSIYFLLFIGGSIADFIW